MLTKTNTLEQSKGKKMYVVFFVCLFVFLLLIDYLWLST